MAMPYMTQAHRNIDTGSRERKYNSNIYARRCQRILLLYVCTRDVSVVVPVRHDTRCDDDIVKKAKLPSYPGGFVRLCDSFYGKVVLTMIKVE